jgi:Spy/CpxP family protein refolding chaperone
MSITRPRLAFALASLVLACAAIGVGCHKDTASETDDGDEPAESTPSDVNPREVARSLGLDRNQEAQFEEIEARQGQGGHHRHGGQNRRARIERRVQRISRALGLTPEQTEKLRLIFRDQAARAARRRAMTPGAEDPRFPQGGGDGPQGGWRSRRGGPQGGPGDPQGGGGWRSRWGGPQGGPGDPQGPRDPDGPGGGRRFRHRGGQGSPQEGPGDPQDPQGPPGYPEGPQDPDGPPGPTSI